MTTLTSPYKHARTGVMIQFCVVLCPKVLGPCHYSCFWEFEIVCAIVSIIFKIISIGSVGKAMRVITFEMRTLFEWLFESPALCLNYTSRQIEGNSQMAQSFHLHLHHMPALVSPARIWKSVAGLRCSQLPPFCPQMSFLLLQYFTGPSVWLNSN